MPSSSVTVALALAAHFSNILTFTVLNAYSDGVKIHIAAINCTIVTARCTGPVGHRYKRGSTPITFHQTAVHECEHYYIVEILLKDIRACFYNNIFKATFWTRVSA